MPNVKHTPKWLRIKQGLPYGVDNMSIISDGEGKYRARIWVTGDIDPRQAFSGLKWRRKHPKSIRWEANISRQQYEQAKASSGRSLA